MSSEKLAESDERFHFCLFTQFQKASIKKGLHIFDREYHLFWLEQCFKHAWNWLTSFLNLWLEGWKKRERNDEWDNIPQGCSLFKAIWYENETEIWLSRVIDLNLQVSWYSCLSATFFIKLWDLPLIRAKNTPTWGEPLKKLHYSSHDVPLKVIYVISICL